jgi:hypothetical protein
VLAGAAKDGMPGGEKRKKRGTRAPGRRRPWFWTNLRKGALVFSGVVGRQEQETKFNKKGQGEREVDMQRISGKQIWAWVSKLTNRGGRDGGCGAPLAGKPTSAI